MQNLISSKSYLRTLIFAAGVLLLLFGMCACSSPVSYESGLEEESEDSKESGEMQSDDDSGEAAETESQSDIKEQNAESSQVADSSQSTDSSQGVAESQSIAGTQSSSEKEVPDVYVYICGEVKFPGVYRLSDGARLYQAIDAAGGFTSEADEDLLNLAMPITDGMQVTVPAKGQEITVPVVQTKEQSLSAAGVTDQAQSASGTSSENVSGVSEAESVYDGKIDLNNASQELLETLSGIGEAKARNIISYREANGGFSDISELKNVDGIGDKLYEKIKDQVTVYK